MTLGLSKGFFGCFAGTLLGGVLAAHAVEGASKWNSLRLDVPSRTIAAPDFELPTLDGDKMRLRDLKGKVVFINFWATWCPPCIREMPSMEKLYREFKGSDFEMLAVSIDARGKEVVAPFVRKLGLTFRILLDPKSVVIRRFGARGLPTTYIVDQEGNIAAAAIGPREWSGKTARELIRRLIRKRRKPE